MRRSDQIRSDQTRPDRKGEEQEQEQEHGDGDGDGYGNCYVYKYVCRAVFLNYLLIRINTVLIFLNHPLSS